MNYRRRRWSIQSKRKKEEEEMRSEARRLAELMRGVRPIKRGGFHSPEKRAERKAEERRAKRVSLKDKRRAYNAGEEVE
jgi:hypothetical protein